VPGMGDDVQSIKAGIMEIADVFVINKSDRDGAERVERELRAMLSIAQRGDKWVPPIVKTVASSGQGVDDLAAAIDSYEQFLAQDGLRLRKKIENWRDRLLEMLRDSMLHRLVREQMSDGDVARYAADVAEHRCDPYSLVEKIIGNWKSHS